MDISALSKKVNLNPGDWIDDIETQPGLRLKVRSSQYRPWKLARDAFNRQNGKRDDEGAVFRELCVIAATHLLIDWDVSKASGVGALTDKGEPVPYSAELAETVMGLDDDYGVGDVFRGALFIAAGKVAEKIAANTKAASGN